VREKYCWLVADKPSEQGVDPLLCEGPRGQPSLRARTVAAAGGPR
jgi:hypothetical protein